MLAHGHDLRTLVTLHQTAIDQAAQGDREGQRRHRRQHQKDQRQTNAAAVRPQKRQQA